MTDGIKKRKRKQKSSTERRHTRVLASNLIGTEMVRCTRCKEQKLPDCKATDNSDVCGNCLKAGNSSCDAFGYNDSAVRVLVDQKRDLNEQERAATEALRLAQRGLMSANRDLAAALSKVERLRVQRLALDQKALTMFEQEGEVLEEQERREAAAANSSSSAGVPSSDLPWSHGYVSFLVNMGRY